MFFAPKTVENISFFIYEKITVTEAVTNEK